MNDNNERHPARPPAVAQVIEGYLKEALDEATVVSGAVVAFEAEMYVFSEHEDPGNPDSWDYAGQTVTVRNIDEGLSSPAGHYLACIWMGRSWRPLPVSCGATALDLDAL